MDTKFLGLHIYNHVRWKGNTNSIILKSCAARCGVASLFHTGNTDTFETVYFACLQTIVKYVVSLDVICLTVKKRDTLETKIVRDVLGEKHRNYCIPLFKVMCRNLTSFIWTHIRIKQTLLHITSKILNTNIFWGGSLKGGTKISKP
jgi:hypothetical protein